MSEVLKSLTGTKLILVLCLQVSNDFYSLKIFSTLFTSHCHNCLFHMDNHMDQVVKVMFVETCSRGNDTPENISKKTLAFFGS